MPGTKSRTVSAHDLDVGPIVEGVPCLVQALRADRPLETPTRYPLDGISQVVIGRGPGGSLREKAQLTLEVPDELVSNVHARLTIEDQRFVLSDEDSKNGTFVNGKRCETAELADGDLIETGGTFFIYRARTPKGLPAEPVRFAESAEGELPLTTFVPSLAKQFEIAARVAKSTVPVIVLGETGTGKEVAAKALHRMSARSGPFLALNCGAIPANLIESELFGSKKGAFSGALDDRPGLVRAADTGTLFLDEIGELPAPAQVALLRVLQEQEVMAIGATRPVKVDVRVVAATHRPLDQLVGSGKFRADLFARLNGLMVRLPPLRDRREDLGLILGSLLRRIVTSAGRVSISRQAARLLFQYPFPHNIRELEKALGLAVAIANPGGTTAFEIGLDQLPEDLRLTKLRTATPAPDAREMSDADRKAYLVSLLEQHGGNISEVARVMGKARMQIHRWIARYGLELETFRKV